MPSMTAPDPSVQYGSAAQPSGQMASVLSATLVPAVKVAILSPNERGSPSHHLRAMARSQPMVSQVPYDRWWQALRIMMQVLGCGRNCCQNARKSKAACRSHAWERGSVRIGSLAVDVINSTAFSASLKTNHNADRWRIA